LPIPFDSDANITAIATAVVETKPIAESPQTVVFFVSKSIKSEAITTSGIEIAIGENPNNIPSAIVARDVCAKPSPIIENLRKTKKTPTIAQLTAIKLPAIIALRIKSKEKILNNSSISVTCVQVRA